MNKVILIGNLTKDIELQTTNSGVIVGKFTLAVSRRFANANGDRETDFINIVVWRELAENCAKYLSKGSKCGVVGEMQTRSYDAQDGTKRYVTEVMANEVEFLNTRAKEEGAENEPNTKPDLTPIDDDTLPF